MVMWQTPIWSYLLRISLLGWSKVFYMCIFSWFLLLLNPASSLLLPEAWSVVNIWSPNFTSAPEFANSWHHLHLVWQSFTRSFQQRLTCCLFWSRWMGLEKKQLLTLLFQPKMRTLLLCRALSSPNATCSASLMCALCECISSISLPLSSRALISPFSPFIVWWARPRRAHFLIWWRGKNTSQNAFIFLLSNL